MEEEQVLDQIITAEHFEDKAQNDAFPWNEVDNNKYAHSSGKRCLCGGHGANDGDRQYKGRQWEKHLAP